MNLLEYSKKFCQDNNIRPQRSKGQNFLINKTVYEKIVSVADLNKEDVILEVGPGLGFLTERLAKHAKKVLAIELDDKLYVLLVNKINQDRIKNVQVLNQNVLDFNPAQIEAGYKIVANLPYNITSVFLRKFLSTDNKPKEVVLMLQKEVAERIAAQVPQMNLLAISVQFFAEVKIVDLVPRDDFWPAPEVDSAIVKLKVNKVKSQKSVEIDEKMFFQLVKFGFSARRKMLKNNLAAGFRMPQNEIIENIKRAGFNEKVRAQELTVDDWKRLLAEF